jgi:hypothetical protein
MKIIEQAKNERNLAITENILSDGSRVYGVLVMGSNIPCNDLNTARDIFVSFDLLADKAKIFIE